MNTDELNAHADGKLLSGVVDQVGHLVINNPQPIHPFVRHGVPAKPANHRPGGPDARCLGLRRRTPGLTPPDLFLESRSSNCHPRGSAPELPSPECSPPFFVRPPFESRSFPALPARFRSPNGNNALYTL